MFAPATLTANDEVDGSLRDKSQALDGPLADNKSYPFFCWLGFHLRLSPSFYSFAPAAPTANNEVDGSLRDKSQALDGPRRTREVKCLIIRCLISFLFIYFRDSGSDLNWKVDTVQGIKSIVQCKKRSRQGGSGMRNSRNIKWWSDYH